MQREKIVAEAKTWLNTPWQHNQCLKGVGCDCVNFPHAVYKACGVPMPDLFNYSRTPKGEKILNYLDECMMLVGVAEDLFDWSPKGLASGERTHSVLVSSADTGTSCRSDRYKDKAIPLQDLIDKSQTGDLLIYSRVFGGPPGHLAIRTDYGKIEALYKQGVTETGMGDELKLLAVYTPEGRGQMADGRR